jgi:D-alanyl-D-alanine-carboxypeptidase/D-alanyl-D-alanine-endopeptidase
MTIASVHRVLLCLLLLAPLLGLRTLRAEGRLPTNADVQALLTPRIDPRTDLGMVVGLIDPDGTRVVMAGKAGPGGAPPLDGNTVFEIGSVTKVFTTSILADMVQRGEVRLEDPVQQYLPPTVRMPTRGGKSITLLDLATQTSGLPRMPGNFAPKDPSNPYADYTVQQMYDFLARYELTRDIGEKYEYSNLGVGLLGHALALKAGVSYEQLVTRRVLRPLGMHDTAIALTPSMKARLAAGHHATGVATSNWDLPTFAGAGALRSTVNDMLKFASANLSAGGPLGAALRQAQLPRRPAGSEEMDIGLAWHVRKRFDRPIVWHNGGTGGYHSFVGLDPKSGTAVVILHNSAASIDDLGFHLLDDRYQAADPAKLPKVRIPIPMTPAALDAYAGEYVILPGVAAIVARRGSTLLFNITGQAATEILPESETEFFLSAADVQVTFVREAAGRVTALVIHQNGRDTRATRKQGGLAAGTRAWAAALAPRG